MGRTLLTPVVTALTTGRFNLSTSARFGVPIASGERCPAGSIGFLSPQCPLPFAVYVYNIPCAHGCQGIFQESGTCYCHITHAYMGRFQILLTTVTVAPGDKPTRTWEDFKPQSPSPLDYRLLPLSMLDHNLGKRIQPLDHYLS